MSSTTHEPARARPVARALAAAVAVLLVVVAIGPGLTRGVALVTVADGLGLDPPRPWAREIVRSHALLGGVEVDRYHPREATRPGRLPQATTVSVPRATARPAIVLLPGATRSGRDDRRVVAIASALARADRVVVVPELDVYAEQLLPSDVDRIAAVASAISEEQPGVVLAGLSFGGSLGLLAAADPRLEGHVRLVATYGAYADLAGVIQATTTGVSLVDGERLSWRSDPRAADVVRTQLLDLLEPAERERVTDALDGHLDPGDLTAELRAVHDLLADPDPTRTMDHVAAAPRRVQARLTEVSPARSAPDLTVPLVTLHAVDDPVIPLGEQRRLAATYLQARTLELATFDHVGIGDEPVRWWVTATDLWRTAAFVHAILEAR